MAPPRLRHRRTATAPIAAATWGLVSRRRASLPSVHSQLDRLTSARSDRRGKGATVPRDSTTRALVAPPAAASVDEPQVRGGLCPRRCPSVGFRRPRPHAAPPGAAQLLALALPLRRVGASALPWSASAGRERAASIRVRSSRTGGGHPLHRPPLPLTRPRLVRGRSRAGGGGGVFVASPSNLYGSHAPLDILPPSRLVARCFDLIVAGPMGQGMRNEQPSMLDAIRCSELFSKVRGGLSRGAARARQ